MKPAAWIMMVLAAALPCMAQHPVFEAGPAVLPTGANLSASGRIDELVLGRLAELNIKPAFLCSDAVFLRRVHLTVIGTIPSENEVRSFLASTEPKKRSNVIDALLQRPEFADFWAMKWGDILRVKAEFPIKLWPNAVQAYHRWIHTSIRNNKPLHEFVHELLMANGSNFREGEVNFYRAMQDRSPQGMAATVALTFLGQRAEKWPKSKLDALAGFFSQISFKSTAEWKEEIVYFDPGKDPDGLVKQAAFPDGTKPRFVVGTDDPRAVFAAWLLRPENPWFSRVMANRIWSWLMGRGVVDEPDDFRSDNPPSNPQLLDFLAQEFAAAHCDMRHMFRVILNSQAFQLSSLPVEDMPAAAINFACYPLRRLEAEVLIDALNQITGTKESYSSPIPEPFTFIPENIRAIALADGSITSSFLELFGRPPRDTGFESERNRGTSAAQRLHLLNSSHVLNKIKASPLVSDADSGDHDVVKLTEKIYLTLLARLPTAQELKALDAHVNSTYSSGEALAADIVWSLVNQPEFYFNH